MSKPKAPKGPINPRVRANVYALAALYLVYLFYQIAKPYLTRDPYGPTAFQFALGAVVLGGFSSVLGEQGYSMLYVVNRCRELEPDPVQEAQLLERVSRASRLRPTHLVDNTNLMGETTPRLLERSEEYIREVSRLTGVPVLCQAVERRLAGQLPAKGKLPVTIYVKPPWEER